MRKEAPLSTMHMLPFDFLINLGLDVFATSIRGVALEEVRSVHVCFSGGALSGVSTLRVVLDLLGERSTHESSKDDTSLDTIWPEECPRLSKKQEQEATAAWDEEKTTLQEVRRKDLRRSIRKYIIPQIDLRGSSTT